MVGATNSDGGQRLDTGLIIGRACPARLTGLLLAGHPILVQARASTASGRRAYDAAAQTLRVAAQDLAALGLFPNLPDVLPTSHDLVRKLQQSVDVKRSRDADGRRFENRFVVLNAPRCPTIWVHLSCGSGAKIDDVTWH